VSGFNLYISVLKASYRRSPNKPSAFYLISDASEPDYPEIFFQQAQRLNKKRIPALSLRYILFIGLIHGAFTHLPYILFVIF